jgi:hypothetical protein
MVSGYTVGGRWVSLVERVSAGRSSGIGLATNGNTVSPRALLHGFIRRTTRSSGFAEPEETDKVRYMKLLLSLCPPIEQGLA